MTRQIKVEYLKEKRTANYKLLFIAPLLFVLLSFLLVLLMGPTPDGEHSYIVAATFNWYSLLILPVIITLMVTNNLKKEKEVNQVFYHTTGASLTKQMIAKNLVVMMELFIILLLSTIFIFLLGSILLEEELSILVLISVIFYLFIGSLPIIAISFILYHFFIVPLLYW
ncbi:ABC transporter permease [Tetragenococcus halophilus]|uniref:ABC transporter permease n=1 Tax=Tetragenococcus halophilus TaxID=51669 RepID=UPI0030D0D12A